MSRFPLNPLVCSSSFSSHLIWLLLQVISLFLLDRFWSSNCRCSQEALGQLLETWCFWYRWWSTELLLGVLVSTWSLRRLKHLTSMTYNTWPLQSHNEIVAILVKSPLKFNGCKKLIRPDFFFPGWSRRHWCRKTTKYCFRLRTPSSNGFKIIRLTLLQLYHEILEVILIFSCMHHSKIVAMQMINLLLSSWITNIQTKLFLQRFCLWMSSPGHVSITLYLPYSNLRACEVSELKNNYNLNMWRWCYHCFFYIGTKTPDFCSQKVNSRPDYSCNLMFN